MVWNARFVQQTFDCATAHSKNSWGNSACEFFKGAASPHISGNSSDGSTHGFRKQGACMPAKCATGWSWWGTLWGLLYVTILNIIMQQITRVLCAVKLNSHDDGCHRFRACFATVIVLLFHAVSVAFLIILALPILNFEALKICMFLPFATLLQENSCVYPTSLLKRWTWMSPSGADSSVFCGNFFFAPTSFSEARNF